MDQNGVGRVRSLAGKAIIYSLSMTLEIPVASKFGNPQAFRPRAIGESQFVANCITWLLNEHIGKLKNPVHLPKPTTIIGWRLISE